MPVFTLRIYSMYIHIYYTPVYISHTHTYIYTFAYTSSHVYSVYYITRVYDVVVSQLVHSTRLIAGHSHGQCKCSVTYAI